jgi:hypothetical protein
MIFLDALPNIKTFLRSAVRRYGIGVFVMTLAASCVKRPSMDDFGQRQGASAMLQAEKEATPHVGLPIMPGGVGGLLQWMRERSGPWDSVG